MVSIRDVAARAGVAISTVSKVLNGYPNVSEDTRKKVNRAVEELNFVPNSVAAALFSKQAGRVALMIDLNVKSQSIDEVAMLYIHGAITEAMKLNLDVTTLFVFMFQGKTAEELVRYLESHSITGMVIYGIARDSRILQELIARESFKCVIVDAAQQGQNTSSVSIDHERAQYQVAEKMLEESGGRRVLYVGGDEGSYVTASRLAGMKSLDGERGLELTVRYADFSEEKARDIVLEMGGEAEAIVCASDFMAIGARKALAARGLERPVCGYDGISLMAYAGQGMYTVRQDFSEISSQAMNELHRLMSGKEGRIVKRGYTLVKEGEEQ